MINVEELSKRTMSVRRRMVDVGSYCQKPIHWGGSLSCVEMLVYLLYRIRIQSGRKEAGMADDLIVSKGHAALAYYSALAEFGMCYPDFARDYQGDGSVYTEELTKNQELGILCATGSLGIGLPYALGRAVRQKKKGCLECNVYCIMGDGELDEGSVWEAVMLASQLNLDNLVLFIDLNGMQSDGETDHILSWQNVKERFSTFGWLAKSVDGHDLSAIDEAFDEHRDAPLVIICHTTKGKGISFMENQAVWHDRLLRGEWLEKARKEVSL